MKMLKERGIMRVAKSEQLFKQAFQYGMNRNLMLQAQFMLHRKTVAHYFAPSSLVYGT